MSDVSRRLLWALRLLALTLLALHLLAGRFSEPVAWGLWPSTYLPAAWRWGLAASAGLLVFFGDRAWLAVRPLAERAVASVRPGTPAGSLALAVLAAVPFYLLRIRHLRWGDAELLVTALGDPYWLVYVWKAPLDVFLHARLWQWAYHTLGWPSPVPVYRILSILAGVAFVWVLLRLAHTLGRDRAERALIAGLIGTLGTMQLFFGYIENYPIMTAGVLLYLWLAVRALREQGSLLAAATALAVTHAFHPVTLILTPSLLYLARVNHSNRAAANVQRSSASPRVFGLPFQLHLALSIVVPYLLVFAGVSALMLGGGHGYEKLLGVDSPGGGDRQWFVPLFQVTTEWQHYTMFSLGHLLDIVNLQALVAPVVLPGLALTALLAWRRLPRRDRTLVFLALAAGFYLLFTLTWNADYGGQKDWDLFAPASVPAALLLAYLLPRALPERAALRAAGWALIAAQAFHTAVWIYRNTLVH